MDPNSPRHSASPSMTKLVQFDRDVHGFFVKEIGVSLQHLNGSESVGLSPFNVPKPYSYASF
jgi:hypothetical protein